jgi:hypothetical protein
VVAQQVVAEAPGRLLSLVRQSANLRAAQTHRCQHISFRERPSRSRFRGKDAHGPNTTSYSFTHTSAALTFARTFSEAPPWGNIGQGKPIKRHLRTTRPQSRGVKCYINRMSARETVVELPFAADCCPCVEKLRTVLPFTVGIRDGAVQLVSTLASPPGVGSLTTRCFTSKAIILWVRANPVLWYTANTTSPPGRCVVFAAVAGRVC